MISKANYFNRVSEIPYESLPEALQEAYDTIQFGSKEHTTWEYLDDDPEFLEIYFEKLHAFLKKGDSKPRKEAEETENDTPGLPSSPYAGRRVNIKPKSARSKKWIVWDIEAKQAFANESFSSIKEAREFVEQNQMELVEVVEKEKQVKQGKSIPERKTKQAAKKEPTRVELVPLELSFIRRYALLHGKVVSRQRVLTLLTSLQKAMLEKRIRKTSPYAKEILGIQDQLIKVVQQMGEEAEISIQSKNLEHYRLISSSQRIRESIALLKRYLSIHGKEGMQEKAIRLKESMERMVKRGKVTRDDPYAEKLNAAYQSLNEFILKKQKAASIHSGELNGIRALVGENTNRGCGVIKAQSEAGSYGDNPKKKTAESTLTNKETLTSSELLNMQFQTIGLQGKFRQLIGDPSVGFTAMVFGQPKSGKSTLMLDFANQLATSHGRVLYAAIEEGYGYTLKEKIQRIGANHPRLQFAEKLPSNLSDYDFVFIDSVSRAGMELEDLIELKNNHPTTSFIFIFHSTKDGKFRGENNLAHEVDLIIEIEPGLAKASGRFNAGGEMGF